MQAPAGCLRRVGPGTGQPGGFTRNECHVEGGQWQAEAVTLSLYVGLLAGPAGKKSAALNGRIEPRQGVALILRKEATGNVQSRDVGTNALDVDPHRTTAGECNKDQFSRMRNVELKRRVQFAARLGFSFGP